MSAKFTRLGSIEFDGSESVTRLWSVKVTDPYTTVIADGYFNRFSQMLRVDDVLLVIKSGSGQVYTLGVLSNESGIVTTTKKTDLYIPLVVSITEDYTVTGPCTIFADPTSGDINIYLSDVAVSNNWQVNVKKIGSNGNVVNVHGFDGQLIDGFPLLIVSAQNATYSVECDASEWRVTKAYKDSENTSNVDLSTVNASLEALSSNVTYLTGRVISLENNTGTNTTQYPGVLSFAASTYAGNEQTNIVVNVTRTAGSDGAITANLAYTGTLVIGTDYTTSLAAGTSVVSLGPGVTSLPITLTVNDIAADGTIILTMSNFIPTASAGQIVSTTVNVTAAAAAPSPGTIRLLTTGATVNEPTAGTTTTMTITATREGGTSGAVSATATILPTSATVNTDYVGKTLSYSWADGVSGNDTDTIVINNNDSKLTDATFTVGLNPPTGAELGSPSAINCVVTNTTPTGIPGIDTVTGAVTHGGAFTIAGTGFGSKAISANLILDLATDADMSSNYADTWPKSGDANFYTEYRTPAEVNAAKAATGGTGAAPATVHARFTKYISGCNSPGADAFSGPNVKWFRNFTRPAFPFYIYTSFYHRFDPNWKPASVTGATDNNTKLTGYSNSLGSLFTSPNRYFEYNPPPSSSVSTAQYHLNENGGALGGGNSGNWWLPAAKNPISSGWVKIELIEKISDTSDGYIYVIEDGVFKDTPGSSATTPRVYQGITDAMTGTNRSHGYAGYARSLHVDNWRYAMLYAQDIGTTALARVILGNASTYSACTVREFQKPSVWSNSSITANWNLGAFNSGTAYLYVIDSNDTPVSTAGKAVTIP